MGSFQVSEKLWSLNKKTELEVVHQKILAERNKGLKEAPGIEAKATSNAIKSWFVVTIVLYGLFLLVLRGVLKIYSNWSFKVNRSNEIRSESQGSTRSNTGWSGRM